MTVLTVKALYEISGQQRHFSYNIEIFVNYIYKFFFIFCLCRTNYRFRGYYENNEIVMQDGSKLVHYQSKGNWSDNFNNYGKFKCKGSLLINESEKEAIKN